MAVVKYLLENWDTVTLIITNIMALFVNLPTRGKKHGQANKVEQ